MATYRDFLLGYSPVSLWALNDATTPTALDSANTFNGTYYGSPALQQDGNWTSYDNSKSVRFHRVNTSDRVEIPNQFVYGGQNKLILEAWFNVEAFPPGDTYPRFILARWGSGSSSDDHYEIYVFSNPSIALNCLRVTMANGTGTWFLKQYGNVVKPGTWQHVVAYKNIGNYRIYLDNVLLEAFTDFTGAINDRTGENLFIGYGKGIIQGWFDGLINNVAFYAENTVPDTADEIDQWVDEHYNWKGGGRIALLSGSARTSLNTPELKYKSEIILPFDKIELENETSLFDNGNSYDKRFCTIESNANESDAENLIDFFLNSARINGDVVTLSLGNDSGFFPFAPDKGDGGDFGVQIIKFEQSGVGERPYKYFKNSITIAPRFCPTYIIPASDNEGALQIGTIGSLRFPSEWFEPESEYQYHVAKLEGQDIMFHDKGESADRFKTRIIMRCGTGKAGELLDHVVNVVRAETFNLITQTDMYAFGIDKLSAGIHTVRFTDGKITIVHDKYNAFEVTLPEIEFIS